MWRRKAKGLTLTFHLAGINNQNFLMRDDQTGTYWQQISGRAISGPLSGSQLDLVYSDELTFDLWRKVSSAGTVLRPVSEYAAHYEKKDWDVRMAKTRTVLNFPGTPLQSRDLVIGLQLSGTTRAYEVPRILREALIEDRVGSVPVLLVTGPDGKSIRVFEARTEDGSDAEFYRKTDSQPADDPKAPLFLDSKTGSEWDFEGCAVSGKSTGHCLRLIPATKDYWFDWRNYHPDTSIFRR